VKISGFDRVRYTGKAVHSIEAIKYTPKGLRLTFTQPLDAKEAADAENFSARRWNYLRSSNYGSATYEVKNPEKKGREKVTVQSARLLPDGRTVEIDLEDFRPVNQLEVKFKLKAKDGTEIHGVVVSEGDPIVIQSAAGLVQSVPKNRIAERKGLGRSLMMSADQLGLKAQDLADLHAFLKTQ